MMRKFLILILCSIITYSVKGQNASHIQSLQHELEVFEVDNPELSEKVNINITNTSLKNFLLAVSKVHNVNISFSNEMVNPTIVNNFSDVKVIDLLIFLAKQYVLDYDITGNIIAVSNYNPPPQQYKAIPIKANYDPQRDYLDLSLQNDSLVRVFKTLTDISGKNIVYAPELENKRLQGYFKQAPFESVMENLALSNDLKVSKSKDGFFLFEPFENLESSTPSRFVDRDLLTIHDTIQQIVSVNAMNKPVKDLIQTLTQELNIQYFLSSPLEEAGNISIMADHINFDMLLEKIFESKRVSELSRNKENPQNQIRSNNRDDIEGPTNSYTFKKEGALYFFGTENQLALKNVEVIPMMYRSVQLLSNPSSNYMERRRNRNQMMNTGNTYYGGNSQGTNQVSDRAYSSSKTSESPVQNTEEIKKIIPEKLLEGVELKIDTELNSFIVSGPAQRIERLKDFISYIDQPVPVILIEVMILEVNKSATVETGIKVGLGEEEVDTKGQVFPSSDIQLGASTINRIIGGFDGFGALNVGKVMPNLYMNIKALETNGNLKVLSTPKLSTLNGHKAHLSSGQTTYYAVTNQAFFGSQIPQTSEVTNYYPIDAELALDIQPYVAGNGEVTLDINVVQSSFNGEKIAEDAPPGMNSREFSSIIRMRNKDVAILGGIEQTTRDDSGSGVPLLARIPVIKWLFSQRRREDSKKKLNILIKPTVIY